jgi:hypothetical protein
VIAITGETLRRNKPQRFHVFVMVPPPLAINL